MCELLGKGGESTNDNTKMAATRGQIVCDSHVTSTSNMTASVRPTAAMAPATAAGPPGQNEVCTMPVDPTGSATEGTTTQMENSAKSTMADQTSRQTLARLRPRLSLKTCILRGIALIPRSLAGNLQ